MGFGGEEKNMAVGRKLLSLHSPGESPLLLVSVLHN